MIKPVFKYLVCVIISLAFLVSGCFKDDLDNLSLDGWNPEVALPLFNAEFKIHDVVNKFETGGYVKADDEGLLSLVYNGEIVSAQGSDLYKLPDLAFSFIENYYDLAFPFQGGEVIDKIKLKSGKIYYDLTGNENENVKVVLKIPGATKYGEYFQHTIYLNENEDSSQRQGVLDLDDYTIDLAQTGNNNEIRIVYEASSLENGQIVVLEQFSGKLTGLLFDFIEGYFGSLNLGEYLDTMKLDVFKNWIRGSVFIEEPQISFNIRNTFGFPIVANFTSFNADNEGESRKLEGEILSDGIECNFPGIPKEGHVGNNSHTVNASNSNLQNFLSISPKRITYGLQLTGDSKAELGQGFFIMDTSTLKVNLDLDIPLHGRIENVFILDTFNFELKNKKRIESATFKLLIENSFPNDAEVQVFFTTADYQKIDSLLTPLKNIISSASVDQNGQIITPTLEETYVAVPNERYKKLQEAEKILVRVKLATFNHDYQSVKYSLNNGLSVKMGVLAGLTR